MAKPLELAPAPYTPAAENEIVIRNRAVAINPVDRFKQESGDLLYGWVKYPMILGNDVAGHVVEVGPGVSAKRFKVGDRVLGHAVGLDKRSKKTSEGGFQDYVVLRANLTSPIPDSMTFQEACVLPLGASTAACGLFMKDFLNLRHPKVNSKPTGETLLVWGGSTSVGCNAIQLAVNAGYEVIATASPKNFEYLKSLGARDVFDYRSPTVVQDIVGAFRDQTSAGAIAIGAGSMVPCVDVVGAVNGRKFVAQASVAGSGEPPASAAEIISVLWAMLSEKLLVILKGSLRGVRSKFIWGSDLIANEVGEAVYQDFLPEALAQGKFVAAPEPYVVGKGLESVQSALDISSKGVSASKIVVIL
ncbi:Zinc-binding alcohol dehydrogenase domain-containing protein cipB 1 [Colletotrichum chlorophyti]|uniref:Zinc-binding alcohol dehydrogenase domain-containing protein cipB 1 n=1 Tax=Colletotrichum chlorophyti TaxID=708187 RepID=A0A1Q8S955_9PEZI|nr:Zinc-binding alcohol dehydrogenase domain-containing protein cipB 1 [Colletotrichum chlorophyti]